MKIVIIEDEQITAKDLSGTIVRAQPVSEIVAVLSSVQESIAFFNSNNSHIDLIFSDIQLGDGSSFEIFSAVSVNAPVIFCTAYDHYALKAFNINSIHYMLKPFSLKSVKEALNKYNELKENFSGEKSKYEAVLEMLNRGGRASSVLVYHQDKILPVKIETIALFFLDSEKIRLITLDGKSYQINKTLDQLESLCGNSFFRVNRQFLVNRAAVKESSQYFGRKLSVGLTISFNQKITVSKTKVAAFLDWLVSV